MSGIKEILIKLFGTLLALAAAVAVDSCDVHEFPDEPLPVVPDPEPEPTENNIYLELMFDWSEMPLFTEYFYDEDSRSRHTRADDAATHDMRFIINFYEADAELPIRRGRAPSRAPISTVVVTRSLSEIQDSIHVPVKLLPDDYRVVVFADFVRAGTKTDLYYDTSDLSSIKVFSDDGHKPGNSDFTQVFRGDTEFGFSLDRLMVYPGEEPEDIVVRAELTRPQARFRFITTDLADFLLKFGINIMGSEPDGPVSSPSDRARRIREILGEYRAVIRYAGYMPSTYNLFSDMPTDAKLGQWVDAEIRELPGGQAELGFDHVIINSGENEKIQLALEIYSTKTGERLNASRQISVPVLRGHRTDILGRFLTIETSSGIGLSPGFTGEYNFEIY